MSWLSLWLLLVGPAFVLCAAPAFGNGGTVQVASEPTGPYEVSVFMSPSPLVVGPIDVSVLVQQAGTRDYVHDARVIVTAEPPGSSGTGVTSEATHEQATNKLFYAAKFELPTEGRWRIRVDVRGAAGAGTVHFEVELTKPTLLDRLLLVGALIALLTVALLWRLSRTRRPGRTSGK